MFDFPRVGAGVIIRPVLTSDAEALLRLRLEALQDSPEAFGEDYDYVAAQPYAAWQDRIAHSNGDGDQVIFVAALPVGAIGDRPAALPVEPTIDRPPDLSENFHLIGMAGVNRSIMRNSRHSASLWGVYVQPAWRGQGVATALVRRCVDWGKSKGLATMRLAVITANPAAIHCYESCGFRSCGVDPKAFFINGRFYDLTRMTRLM
jgi:RimJ/RimL family protein N-acetyltransferase